MNPIDIVITTWKRELFIKECLKSIKENTTYQHRITLIWNEGKESDIEDIRKEIDNIVVLKDNWGLEPAKNIGMSFVKSKYFISTDNDCLPMQPNENGDWLSQLIKLMDNNQEYGAISCRTQVMIGTGNIFDGKEDQNIVEFPHPGGSLRIMKRDLVNKIGGWRSDVNSRGQEEKYICGKINEMGFKTGFATKIKCWHMFGDGNWGYGDMKPEEHGHNPVWHPAIENGDDLEERKKWIGY